MSDRHRKRPDVDALVLDPSAHFPSPDDVLTAAGLGEADRLRILESWVEDARRISESEAENMAGRKRPRLREATLALITLRQRIAQR